MEPYIGQITLFAGNFAPQGWEFCNGQLLPIASNSALYSVIGAVYGGDGQNTFALPDLRGRAPIGTGEGAGLSNRPLGASGGVESVPLTIVNMPAHSHQPMASSSATSDSPEGAFWAPASQGANPISAFGTQATVAMNSHAVGSTGGGQPHQNMQPYTAMNYIIATAGIYPSRP